MPKNTVYDICATVMSGDSRSKDCEWISNSWGGMVTVSTLLSLLTSSFLAAFNSSYASLSIILYLCDLIYFIETACKVLRCLRLTKEETSCKKLTLRWWLMFLFDVFSLLPLELFAFGKTTATPWLHNSRMYRLNRIVRFYKLFTYVGHLEEKLGANLKLIRTLKHLLVGFAIIHLMACGWYYIACDNQGVPDAMCPGKMSWATAGSMSLHPQKIPDMDDHEEEERKKEEGKHKENVKSVKPKSAFDMYMTCLYWAANTATSTGYGDIHAVSFVEKWFSIIGMMVSIVFFFGSLLGDIASSMTNSDVKRASYKHKLNAVINQLRQKNICNSTREIIYGFYEHMWNTNRPVGDENFLEELPTAFQSELLLNVNRHVLQKVPLFENTSSSFKRMLSPYIKSSIYFPGQTIFKEHDIGHTLFYIRRGEVEVFKDGKANPIKRLKEGSFFGEISALMYVPRTATTTAAEYCDILSLDKQDLSDVLRHFPEEQAILESVIEKRYENAEFRNVKRKVFDSNGEEPPKVSAEKRPSFCRFGFLQLFDGSIVFAFSKIYAQWRCLIFAFTAAFVIIHTSIASFEVTFDRFGYGDSVFLKCLFAFWYIYDALLVADVYVSSRAALEHPEKGFVSDLREIKKMRVKTVRFWIDVMSVLPIEIFAFYYTSSRERWYAATFLRSNRLIRIYHIPEYFSDLEKDITNSISKIRTFMLLFYIFLITHLTSCVWYLQACFGSRCSTNSWAHKAQIDGTLSAVNYYITSLYWSCATMTSSGYGDISAVSKGDEVVVVFVLVIGLLLYGYCLCSIAATLNNLSAPKVGFTEHVYAVTKFMKDLKVSNLVIKDVESYLSTLWRTHKGLSMPGQASLMGDMPLSLQQDVAYEEMKEIIQDVPIFRDTEKRFQKMVALSAKSTLFKPGDTIVHIGDMCREMYIVRRGTAEVLSSDKSCVVETFGPGGYFGEIALLYGESSPADVRAKTYCEIVSISKFDLDNILPSFPIIAKQLKNISENIDVLKKIQATAHEEAKRSAKKKTEKVDDKSKLESKDKHWKTIHINPLYKGGARKISLPTRLTVDGLLLDTSMTSEYRQQMISELDKQEREQYYAELKPILKFFARFLMKRTVSPEQSKLRTWIFISVIVSYVYIILLGIQIAFLPDDEAMIAICYCFDAFFVIDCYLKMHVAYYNKKGILVSCPIKTAGKYLKSNFLLDILPLIPFEAFFQTHGGYFVQNYLIIVEKLIIFENSLILEHAINGITSHLGLSSYLCLSTHFFACAWFYVACPEIRSHQHSYSEHENKTVVDPGISSTPLDFHHMHFRCGKESWAGRMEKVEIQHEQVAYQYLVSFYWAVSTLCSVGYGDIHAYVTSEMALSCVCMVFGVVYFGYILASVAASMSNADALRAGYQDQLEAIKLFLKSENVKPSLADRIMKHYEYVWKRTKGVDSKNPFQGLPTAMQGNICISLYQSMLQSVPFFKNTELGFIKLLSRHIRPFYVLKGEYIVRKGDLWQEITFIRFGGAEVVTDDEEPVVLKQIGTGDFFGDVGVVCNAQVNFSIRSRTNTDLFVLSKCDLDAHLQSFPQIKSQISLAAQEMKDMLDKKKKQGIFDFEIRKIEETSEDKKISIFIKDDKVTLKGKKTGPQARERNESGKNSLFEKLRKWSRFVLSPNNPLKYYLERVNCIGIFLSYLVITYVAAYQHHSTGILCLIYLLEVSFIFEMYLNFHIPYTLANEEVVDDFEQIWNHYVKGDFKMDLISNLPVDLLGFAFESEHRLQILSYIRLFRIIRIRRIFLFYQEWVTRLNVNILNIRLSEIGFKVAISVHLFACIWYMLACIGHHCKKKSWVGERNHTLSDPFEMYVDSIYWAVASMTSTGYGDFHATNEIEMLFAAFVMLAGKCIFGFVLGQLTSSLADTEAQRVSYEERLNAVKAQMTEQKISLALQKRVLDFFRYSWKTTRGVDISSHLLNLPYCLRAEFYHSLVGERLEKVPMFQGCSPAFLRLLCSKALYQHFSAGEYVVKRGDVEHCLYLIKRGKVESISDDNVQGEEQTEKRKTYEADSVFGESEILSDKLCSTTMKTITEVDLFSFSKSAIESALHSFGDQRQIFKYSSRRLSVIEEEQNHDVHA
eukprot:gene12973-3735_t